MRRAVAYVRVSKVGARGDDLMSPDIQMAAIRQHCDARGDTIVATLEDLDRTGLLWRRRQMEAAVQLVEARHADVIVVWKVSRVSRNRRDWAIAVDRVESAGGQLESATEPVDASTSTGRFTRGMLAELAAFESERIGEVWRSVHAQRSAAGLPHYAPPRLGYTYVRGTGYEVDPATAPVVVELYDRYIRGDGVGALVLWLRAAQVPVPKGGGQWTRFGVRYLLQSGFAAGYLQKHDPACRCGKKGGACPRRVHVPGAQAQIITPAVWDAYRASQGARKGTVTRTAAAGHALRGLVVCDGCGRPMQLQGPPDRPRSAYVCRHRGVVSGTPCPAPAWCRRDACEAAVAAWLPTVALEVDDIARAARSAPTVDRRAFLADTVASVDDALVRLAVDRARRRVPDEVLDRAEAELLAERAAAQRELRQQPPDLSAVRDLAQGLLVFWSDGAPAAANEVVRQLLRVRVARGESPRVVPMWVQD